MHRKKLQRIYELWDLLQNPGSSHAYFQDFDHSIATQSVKRKHFIDIESDLQGLDPDAWNQLKGKVARLFERRDPTRGWQAAFDILNQAKAYNHLVGLGYTEVEFIPESNATGQKTPDLQARFGSTKVLCEVKTINVSDFELEARAQSIVRDTQVRLPDAFFQKLERTLRKAKEQMDSHYANDDAKKIAYVIVKFDDGLHEYVEGYLSQLRSFVETEPVPKCEVVFDIKPAFYSATA